MNKLEVELLICVGSGSFQPLNWCFNGQLLESSALALDQHWNHAGGKTSSVPANSFWISFPGTTDMMITSL